MVSYGYDALGRPTSVSLRRTSTLAVEPVVSWAGYLPFGPLQGTTMGNGLNLWSTRDGEYSLDGLFLTPASGGAALMQRWHWVGDGLNLLALDDDVVAPAQTQRFSYHDEGRLLTASGPYGALAWSYDRVGNRR